MTTKTTNKAIYNGNKTSIQLSTRLICMLEAVLTTASDVLKHNAENLRFAERFANNLGLEECLLRLSKQSDQQKLKKSIETMGVCRSLIVIENSDGTFTVLDGNRRLLAAQQLGMKDIRIVVVPSDMTPAEISDLLFLIHGPLQASWGAYGDAQAVKKLLALGRSHIDIENQQGFSIKKQQLLLRVLEISDQYRAETTATTSAFSRWYEALKSEDKSKNIEDALKKKTYRKEIFKAFAENGTKENPKGIKNPHEAVKLGDIVTDLTALKTLNRHGYAEAMAIVQNNQSPGEPFFASAIRTTGSLRKQRKLSQDGVLLRLKANVPERKIVLSLLHDVMHVALESGLIDSVQANLDEVKEELNIV